MYNKNLSEDLRLRLSKTDMDFLRELSSKYSVSVSQLLRSIIGEYRRALESLEKEVQLSDGDTKTYINH